MSIVSETSPTRFIAPINASEPATSLVARPARCACAFTSRSIIGMIRPTSRLPITVRNVLP